MTFKYPNQSDCAKIGAGGSLNTTDLEQIDVRDFLNLEFNRLLCLVRKWSLSQKLNNQAIMNLHPKIVKGVIVEIRSKIGMDGII
jgi:hypothetical protein